MLNNSLQHTHILPLNFQTKDVQQNKNQVKSSQQKKNPFGKSSIKKYSNSI